VDLARKKVCLPVTELQGLVPVAAEAEVIMEMLEATEVPA